MVQIREVAAQILQSVVENGRVLQDADGNHDPESVENEVEFEAATRGYENSEEIGKAARSLI